MSSFLGGSLLMLLGFFPGGSIGSSTVPVVWVSSANGESWIDLSR